MTVRVLAELAGVSRGTADTALRDHRGRVNRAPGNVQPLDISEGGPPAPPPDPAADQQQRELKSKKRADRHAATDPRKPASEPAPLPRAETIQLELDIETQKVADLTSDLEIAERRARLLADADNPETAIRLREINNLIAENRGLRAQINEWQTKAEEYRREAVALRKKMKASGLE